MFIVPMINIKRFSLSFLLGILNSKLINYLFATRFLNLAIKAEYLKHVRLPMSSCEEQQEISHLVSHIMEVKQQLTNAFSEQDKMICQQKIDILDRQIDQKVYKLYGLTEDEINMIEANS